MVISRFKEQQPRERFVIPMPNSVHPRIIACTPCALKYFPNRFKRLSTCGLNVEIALMPHVE